MEVVSGVVQGFDAGTYTATVQMEGNPVYVAGVPVSRGIAGAEVVVGRDCVVVMFDRYEPSDGMLVGVY